jgi:hypothetical protein
VLSLLWCVVFLHLRMIVCSFAAPADSHPMLLPYSSLTFRVTGHYTKGLLRPLTQSCCHRYRRAAQCHHGLWDRTSRHKGHHEGASAVV